MTDTHWFDTLHKALVSETSRRALLSTVSAMVFGGIPRAEAAKNRKKNRNGNRKRKRKGTPNPAAACSGRACAAVPEWAGDQPQIDHCEFICEQCGGDDPRDFCIVQRASGPVADCCDIEEQCCGDRCCDGYCCDLGAGRGKHCVIDAMACCPDDFASGVCDRGTQKCCAGYGCQYRTEDCPDDDCGGLCTRLGLTCCHGACFDTTVDTDHCGRCDRECTGRLNDCCEGDCVDVETDLTHCGGCNRPCLIAGMLCVDANCRCPEGQLVCDGACVAGPTCPFVCGGDSIPHPCPGYAPDVCVPDWTYVCCSGFQCVILDDDPLNYICCGTGDDWPFADCRRFDDDPCGRATYPPLATHCGRDNPLCA